MNSQLLNLLKVYRGVCLNYPPLERQRVISALENLAQFLSIQAQSISVQVIQESQPVPEQGLYLLDNFPTLLNELSGWDKHQVVQWLVETLSEAQDKNQYFIILNSQGETLNEPLGSLIPVFDWQLPNLEEIKAILREQLGEKVREELALAVAGLSNQEIRLGVKLLNRKNPIKPQLMAYKQQQLKKLGLEFLSTPTLTDVGGLDRIKQAIEQVAIDYTKQARILNIPFPRGWLLAGPPGTGKTFTAKICAAKLGFPLISIGVDLIKSKGANYLKLLLQRIEQASPAVCYFDEFDKFFDPETAVTGGGNSKETLGVLLTWLQEKETQTFVIATLNRLNALPPELTRAGRFDRIFYVGFPSPIERKEIIELHASPFDPNFAISERDWRILLSRTQNCTGAELKAIVENAARSQFYEQNHTQLTLLSLINARKTLTPLYVRDTERILAMENRAKYVSEPASSPDQSIFAPPDVDLWGEKN